MVKLLVVFLSLLAQNYVLTGCLRANSMAQAPVDEFKVAIRITTFQSQIEKYPKTNEAVLKALDTWESDLPIKIIRFVDDPQNVAHSPAIWFPIQNADDHPDLVQIMIDDLQGPPYLYHEGIIGMWVPERNRLYLDGDFLENHPDKAYSTALHELGHMFGLPHMLGEDDNPITGFIILPMPSEKAQDCVMYPVASPKHKQDTLSSLDIRLARWHVLHFMTIPGYRSQACKLTLSLKGS